MKRLFQVVSVLGLSAGLWAAQNPTWIEEAVKSVNTSDAKNIKLKTGIAGLRDRHHELTIASQLAKEDRNVSFLQGVDAYDFINRIMTGTCYDDDEIYPYSIKEDYLINNNKTVVLFFQQYYKETSKILETLNFSKYMNAKKENLQRLMKTPKILGAMSILSFVGAPIFSSYKKGLLAGGTVLGVCALALQRWKLPSWLKQYKNLPEDSEIEETQKALEDFVSENLDVAKNKQCFNGPYIMNINLSSLFKTAFEAVPAHVQKRLESTELYEAPKVDNSSLSVSLSRLLIYRRGSL